VEIASDGAASSKWQQPFDAEMADVFRVQGEIAGKVAAAMSVAVGRTDQERLVEVPTRNTAAYDTFLRGEAIYWSTGTAPVEVRRALAEYEQAARADSGFAEAWAGVARAKSVLYGMSTPTPALAREAREAADRALQLAPNGAFAHVAVATVHLNIDLDAVRALQEIQAARALTPNDPEILSRLAVAYMSLGKFDEALASARVAQQLDPRATIVAGRLRGILFLLRRYSEARVVADRALALAQNTTNVQARAVVELADGDLAAARTVVATAATTMNQDRLFAYMAMYNDLGWVMDEAGQRRILALGPEFFDDDRAGWAIARAHGYSWLGDSALMRAWGDTAAREFAAQARTAPNDSQRHILLAVAQAYAGRRAEALAAAKRGIELASAEHDYSGAEYYDRQLARMHVLLGDHDKALDLLEGLLARPSYISPGWLRIEPTWRSLKGNPRFEKMIAGVSAKP
jgi:tetratricopeptide (TPR) repeat protein